MKRELLPEGMTEEELATYFTKNGEETAKDLHPDKPKEEKYVNIKSFTVPETKLDLHKPEVEKKSEKQKEEPVKMDVEETKELPKKTHKTKIGKDGILKKVPKLKRKRKEKSQEKEVNTTNPKRKTKKKKPIQNTEVEKPKPIPVSTSSKPKILLKENDKDYVKDSLKNANPRKKKMDAKQKEPIVRDGVEQKLVQKKLADFMK